jgi:hypothetical protein
VFIFAGASRSNKEGEEISPEFPNESKAEAFAIDWMTKHPEGSK